MEPLFDKKKINHLKEIFLKNKETIAVAESVTAGLLQAALASADNAIRFFHGGITVYNLGQKTRHLHIDPIYGQSCNCVSDIIARQLALNVCSMFCSDWGIGITGYASAVPESDYKIFCYYAIARRGAIIQEKKLSSTKDNALEVQIDFVSDVVANLAEHCTAGTGSP